MKKLLAFLLILMVALNLAVLLQKSEARPKGDKTLGRMAGADLNDVKPGMLPGLVSF